MTALVQKKTAASPAVDQPAIAILDAAPTVGNLLVGVHFTRGTSAIMPAGFTQDLLVVNTTNNDQFRICSRVVEAGDGTSYEFSATPSIDQNAVTLMEFAATAGRQWTAARFDVAASTARTVGVSTISTGLTANRAVDDSVSVAGVGIRGTVTAPSVNNSFTLEGQGESVGINNATSLTASRIETATGTSQADFSWTTAVDVMAGVVVYKTVAGAVYGVSLADSHAAGDSASSANVITRSLADSHAITDGYAGNTVFNIVLADSLAATDAISNVLNGNIYLVTLADTQAVTDALIAGSIEVATLADALSVTDSTNGTLLVLLFNQAIKGRIAYAL